MGRKYDFIPEELEKPSVQRSIQYDFGKEFAFRDSMGSLSLGTRYTLRRGIPLELTLSGKNYKITRYILGISRKVLRLYKEIPTFDVYDRQSDSWHELYLFRDRTGPVKGYYCTGGYEIATFVGFRELLSCPPEIEKLLG